MKIQLTSVKPADLVKDRWYLCGHGSLVDELYWKLCCFNGKQLADSNGPIKIPFNSDFFPFRYCLDGHTEDWLIFALPDVGFPDNGASHKGPFLWNNIVDALSPTGKRALIVLDDNEQTARDL